MNYATLGYGDVIPNKEWQLLGPITAMNGVLMFGWSTAVIFEVLRRPLELGTPRSPWGMTALTRPVSMLLHCIRPLVSTGYT